VQAQLIADADAGFDHLRPACTTGSAVLKMKLA
jgi:hypothetical protein